MREKCPYSEIMCSVFSHIRTEYGKILHISSIASPNSAKYVKEKFRIRTLLTQFCLVLNFLFISIFSSIVLQMPQYIQKQLPGGVL